MKVGMRPSPVSTILQTEQLNDRKPPSRPPPAAVFSWRWTMIFLGAGIRVDWNEVFWVEASWLMALMEMMPQMSYGTWPGTTDPCCSKRQLVVWLDLVGWVWVWVIKNIYIYMYGWEDKPLGKSRRHWIIINKVYLFICLYFFF